MAVTDSILKNSCGGGSGGSSPTKEETLENKTIPLEKNNITANNAVGEILIVNSNGVVEPLNYDNDKQINFMNFIKNNM
jgi:hypothetical protein